MNLCRSAIFSCNSRDGMHFWGFTFFSLSQTVEWQKEDRGCELSFSRCCCCCLLLLLLKYACCLLLLHLWTLYRCSWGLGAVLIRFLFLLLLLLLLSLLLLLFTYVNCYTFMYYCIYRRIYTVLSLYYFCCWHCYW